MVGQSPRHGPDDVAIADGTIERFTPGVVARACSRRAALRRQLIRAAEVQARGGDAGVTSISPGQLPRRATEKP